MATGGRKRELIGKRQLPFRVPLEMAEALDRLRGDRPRNTYLREECLKPFLAADPPRPPYHMPRDAPKTEVYFEVSAHLAEEIEAWGERHGVGWLSTVCRLALYWHIQRLARTRIAEEALERMSA